MSTMTDFSVNVISLLKPNISITSIFIAIIVPIHRHIRYTIVRFVLLPLYVYYILPINLVLILLASMFYFNMLTSYSPVNRLRKLLFTTCRLFGIVFITFPGWILYEPSSETNTPSCIVQYDNK